ncbi:DUF453 domain protein [Aspergillus heteromorphus CBS 117.55]|uniref:DUF453 domain protein n=1 Tax=Aspergillus heteromorphus CBS 117.55 TaxID=1448321 RepID=A0A317WC31_9EURO|nr:DUF453 domain protein [Aspergillus heteromorphus CBS 117.55]PWY82927.1 DUF453 domain protein [Aspergillus heteromorphus CBS 117.55]
MKSLQSLRIAVRPSASPRLAHQCVRPLSTTMQRFTQARRQQSLPAAYYRGGTSRAIMIRREDLPPDQTQWDPILLGCIGSPDPYGRQLDGMGGGISSLSKVCVVGPSTHPDADVDYTFISLGIKTPHVDLSSNCGNMSAAVGPFAIDSGMIPLSSSESTTTTVRILNTNTNKIIHANFPIIDGEAQADGSFAIDGVAGTASRIELRFIDPAGSRTGHLFPTGNHIDTIDAVPVTCIDAGNPCCFVEASALGVSGVLTPQQIDDHPSLKAQLESIRRQAGVKMGLAGTEDDVPGSVPKIGFVSRPGGGEEGEGEGLVGNGNVVVRAMSVGQPHKAVPVTVALALATAANMEGTVVSTCVVRDGDGQADSGSGSGSGLVIAHASGTLEVDARFDERGDVSFATVFRTARRLMEGRVFWKG